MMGTGGFAVPSFRALVTSGHDVPVVVTRPNRAAVGKRPPPLSPMRGVAEELTIRVFDPEDVNSASSVETLAGYRPDLLVVCDYGQILSKNTLAIARWGGINLHGSLLPKYRGAAPVNWAIYHGDTETGVTVIHMTPRLDAGPTVAQASTAIDSDENAVELESRLAEIGAPLVCQSVTDLASGRAQPIEQIDTMASRAPRLKKSDGAIDWRRPAEAIRNQIRAFQPWPRSFSFWHRVNGPPLRLTIDKAQIDKGIGVEDAPSTVVSVDRDRLVIAAGNHGLAVETIQPAGKRSMDVREFLLGYPVRQGDRFGPE